MTVEDSMPVETSEESYIIQITELRPPVHVSRWPPNPNHHELVNSPGRIRMKTNSPVETIFPK